MGVDRVESKWHLFGQLEKYTLAFMAEKQSIFKQESKRNLSLHKTENLFFFVLPVHIDGILHSKIIFFLW